MLNWANRFSIFCLLDNNGYHFEQPAFECLLAAGNKRQIALSRSNAYAQLRDFFEAAPSWLFGHLGYGLKDEVEILNSQKEEPIDFGRGFFFEPEILLKLQEGQLTVFANGDEDEVFAAIMASEETNEPTVDEKLLIQKILSKEQYINLINKLLGHIKRGDCYEINFCQPFMAEATHIDALSVYKRLITQSPVPFAALYKLSDKYCICASPERYLKKTGQQLISQPIKGTSKRYPGNRVKDAAGIEYLKQSQKEKSENVMVVDLVRNDLSRVCKEGSVYVKELFGIYSFPQVHQMISTVEGTLREDVHFTDAIKASFPMGSMTGAPKKRVMELIEEYEPVGRGLFSGSIGYISPDADFDFNVVIRSIFYDTGLDRLYFSAGSGITFYSEPEKEYEECLLKAAAIVKVLNEE